MKKLESRIAALERITQTAEMPSIIFLLPAVDKDGDHEWQAVRFNDRVLEREPGETQEAFSDRAAAWAKSLSPPLDVPLVSAVLVDEAYRRHPRESEFGDEKTRSNP